MSVSRDPNFEQPAPSNPDDLDEAIEAETARTESDEDLDRSLRPRKLADFVNQEQVTAQLAVFIEAARRREESLDHVLLAGPPGLGKTSLAHIIAHELGVPLIQTAGPALERKADIAAFLTALEPGSVFFIDEIHRLNRAIEETLYPAMEDRQLPIVLGQGAGARTVTLDLPPFTLVGATTRAGLLTTPLRDRFGIPIRLEFYDVDELERIVARGARVLGIGMSPDGANEIAKRSRGTPRIAGRLLRRVRDFALVEGAPTVTRAVADGALKLLDVDAAGLDLMDRKYLTLIAASFGGGPVGIETIAAALSEPRDAIEDIIEPFLIQKGFVQRTPRGRMLTPHAFRHLGLAEPARDPAAQYGLFAGGDEDG
jgi:Holliday junction DNA helicase RuvB